MKLHYVVLYVAVLLCSCKAIGWWGDPATPGTQPGTVATPGGGTYTPPAAPTGPVEVAAPGGGTLVYTPAPTSAEPTKGQVVTQTAQGIAGAAGGPLAALAVGLLGSLISAAVGKKSKAATA